MEIAKSLKKALQNGKTTFAFVKKSTGETRIAHGTLNMDIIPKNSHPKGAMADRLKNATTIQPYYDLDAEDWRSYDETRLVCIY